MSERYSSYISYLPEIYKTNDQSGFLERFLGIFKEVLSERTNDNINPAYSLPDEAFKLPNEGIEEILDRIHEFFNPLSAPGSQDHANRNFLRWLAEWVSFANHAHFEDTTLRTLIPQVIPLYAQRGTPEGLIKYLELIVGKGNATLYETRLAKHFFGETLNSHANAKFLLESNFVFGLKIDLTNSPFLKDNPPVEKGKLIDEDIDYAVSLIKAIVLSEKPAHTDVVINILVSGGLQIAVTSTVGVDTMIGYGTNILESTASFSLA